MTENMKTMTKSTEQNTNTEKNSTPTKVVANSPTDKAKTTSAKKKPKLNQ